MAEEWWTWSMRVNPNVAGVLTAPATDLGWCDRLETAAGDSTVGKVLCVCASAAIARKVLTTPAGGQATPPAAEALELLNRWVDDPTEERFARICEIIFGEDQSHDLDPYGVVWWALRTATSTVGFGEAGWALATTCSAATAAGFSPQQLHAIAERAIMSRTDQ